MVIQSLSVVVPPTPASMITRDVPKCVHHCPFCVSRNHPQPYGTSSLGHLDATIQEKRLGFDQAEIELDYANALSYSRDNGCNVMLLTGAIEPLQNLKFISRLLQINKHISSPFRNIEIQAVGFGLLEEGLLVSLRRMGVTTIAISVNDLFDDDENRKVCGNKDLPDLKDMCKAVRMAGLNLRLSINLLSTMEVRSPKITLEICKSLGANQVTFRTIYLDKEHPYAKHTLHPDSFFMVELNDYILDHDKLEPLPTGLSRFDINDMSVVWDENCMVQNGIDDENVYRYLILQPNRKLYSRWDRPASLVF